MLTSAVLETVLTSFRFTGCGMFLFWVKPTALNAHQNVRIRAGTTGYAYIVVVPVLPFEIPTTLDVQLRSAGWALALLELW
jgi:hypothetical protein